jgi:glutaredoxin-like YruB-family protein
MNTIHVNSYNELAGKIKKEPRSFLLIYKSGSDMSEKALAHVTEAASQVPDIKVFLADVIKVSDIHTEFSITSAPALLEFENNKLKNVTKGAHDSRFYKTLFENIAFFARAEKDGVPVKSVTIYSTPTCSWCSTLKSYLRKNGIRYTEIDVSRDESAAQEMVRRSGQQGVPQTLINGEMVVGFDKSKINRLLEIEG